jgi:hypothetical protein
VGGLVRAGGREDRAGEQRVVAAHGERLLPRQGAPAVDGEGEPAGADGLA